MGTDPGTNSVPRSDIGQRMTRQRALIANALADITTFASAQDIHRIIIDRGDKVGLNTVYRTLQQMAELGIIDNLRDTSGEMLYRNCATEEHHHHLVCTECRSAVEVDGGPVEHWAEDVVAEHGFLKHGHTAEIFGLCGDCVAKKTDASEG